VGLRELLLHEDDGDEFVVMAKRNLAFELLEAPRHRLGLMARGERGAPATA
jgi:hypothetical protein